MRSGLNGQVLSINPIILHVCVQCELEIINQERSITRKRWKGLVPFALFIRGGFLNLRFFITTFFRFARTLPSCSSRLSLNKTFLLLLSLHNFVSHSLFALFFSIRFHLSLFSFTPYVHKLLGLLLFFVSVWGSVS